MDFELPDEQTIEKMNRAYADMLKSVSPLSVNGNTPPGKQDEIQGFNACARTNKIFILYFVFYLGYNLGYGTAIYDTDGSMGGFPSFKRPIGGVDYFRNGKR